jgi:hypothetical protein
MFTRTCKLALCLSLSLGARAADLATAPSEDLLKVYAQLRSLHGSTQWAVTENVAWGRDAATFTLQDGHLTFAEPVGGRVLAAYFEGQGSIEMQAPTPALQRQLARFTGGPALEDDFKQAVFFFTDDSASQLQNLMRLSAGANADLATKAFGATEKKYAESFNGWWSNERKGNFQMHNLAARMLADLTDPSSKGFFLADFKGHHHGDLIYLISWNRDSLLLPYLANDEEVMLIHYNRDEYFEWWAGFHRTEEYAHTAWPEHRTLLAHFRDGFHGNRGARRHGTRLAAQPRRRAQNLLHPGCAGQEAVIHSGGPRIGQRPLDHPAGAGGAGKGLQRQDRL